MNAQQLRNSILQQAIQGKLVLQDPNDEPASVLLQRIRKEKERLVKEGKLKKKDLESKPIEEDEIPFEIPESWEWVRLGEIVEFIGGYAYDSHSFCAKTEYQVLRLGNVKNGHLLLSKSPVYISEQLATKTKAFRCEVNDILITMTGTRLKRDYFYSCLIQEKDNNLFVNQRVGCLRPFDSFFSSYLSYCLKSKDVLDFVFQFETGTANQGNLGSTNILKTPIPIPPLAEQRRIVAKIEELMPLVERYGKAQQALDQLNESLPARLRQSILQEAIQGRLVPQDPKEEPASELLKRIRKEKEQLVKEGKLKKKDLESKPIKEDEIPFEIPESWEWVRLDFIIELLNGYSFESNKYVDNGIRVIRITNVQDGFIIDKQPKYYPIDSISEISDFLLRENDLLMSLTGNVGRVGFLQKELLPAALNQRVACLRFYSAFVLKAYVFYYFQSPFFLKACQASSKGMAQKNMSTEWLKKHLIPLPPLSEQKRIVAKVEELFGVMG